MAALEIDQVSNNTVKVSKDAGDKLGKINPEIEKTFKLVDEISKVNIE